MPGFRDFRGVGLIAVGFSRCSVQETSGGLADAFRAKTIDERRHPKSKEPGVQNGSISRSPQRASESPRTWV